MKNITISSLIAPLIGFIVFTQYNVRNSDIKNIPTDSLTCTTPKLIIFDSLVIHDKISGFNEYMPLQLSPSGKLLLLMPGRGGKKMIFYNLPKKKIDHILDFSHLKKDGMYKEGIYNTGFISDSVIAITFKNELFIYNIYSNKLISQTQMPIKGYYSSYTKTLLSIVTEKDTFLISQLYTGTKGKYESETDSFFDLSPVSIYQKSTNRFTTLKLPNSSLFKTKNLGQTIVSFNLIGNDIYFTVSPECTFYKFNLDRKSTEITNFKTHRFKHQYSDSLKMLDHPAEFKNILKLSSSNFYTNSLTGNKDYLLISYTKGLSNDEYNQTLSFETSETDRALNYAKARKSFVMFVNLKRMVNCGIQQLPDNIEGAALMMNDSTCIMKPKTAYFFRKDSIVIYTAKIKY